MDIRLVNLTKIFADKNSEVRAVDNLDITIPSGKLIGLLGPSGCGKSTTLYMIAGLLEPSSGQIFFGEDDVTALSAEKRGIGLVFQNYALYPHMTVRQNIMFPLQNMKLPKAEILARTVKYSRLVGIEELLDRKPKQLSGGQQQRVAIARTLAPNPKVLFMDEPLSNLDAKLRLEMRTELKRLHKETNSTFVYVTHDQLEAMTLATEVCLMKEGVVQQYKPPLTVYEEPSNLFVADFVGNPTMNFIKAKAKKVDDHIAEITFHNMTFIYNGEETLGNLNENVVLGVRPEFIKISNEGINAKVYSTLPSGMETTVKFNLNGELLTGVVFGIIDYEVDQEIKIDFVGNDIILFDKDTTNRVTNGTLTIKK